MKKLFYLLFILLNIFIFSSSVYAKNFYPVTAMTGGGTGALDKLSDADLNDGDVAILVLENDGTYGNAVFIYTFDATSTQAESEPEYIRPDDYDTGVWELATLYGGVLTTSKAASYTLGTDNSREAYGGIVYVTSAATITLPAIADGMSCSVITVGAIAVSVDTNASDLMYLDGTALDDGDKATNTSTTGDTLVCTYYSADGWWCMSGSPDGDHWTDGGP